MKLLWLTDIHFGFLARLAEQAPQAVLLGGDLSAAPRLAEDLESIGAALQVPIYFVLGNHDFYYGSIKKVRNQRFSGCRVHHSLRAQPQPCPKAGPAQPEVVGAGGTVLQAEF